MVSSEFTSIESLGPFDKIATIILQDAISLARGADNSHALHFLLALLRRHEDETVKVPAHLNPTTHPVSALETVRVAFAKCPTMLRLLDDAWFCGELAGSIRMTVHSKQSNTAGKEKSLGPKLRQICERAHNQFQRQDITLPMLLWAVLNHIDSIKETFPLSIRPSDSEFEATIRNLRTEMLSTAMEADTDWSERASYLPCTVLVKPTDKRIFATRHSDVRSNISKAINAVVTTPDIKTVLVHGAHGTPVSIIAQILADTVAEGTPLYDRPNPLKCVLRTEMMDHVSWLIHHPQEQPHTLLDCIQEAKDRDALLVVSGVQALNHPDANAQNIHSLVDDLVMPHQPDGPSCDPVVAIYEKEWYLQPDPSATRAFLKRNYREVAIPPYVRNRRGDHAMSYGLAGWLERGATFSAHPDLPLDQAVETDPLSKHLLWQVLQEIFTDVADLEDGAYLAVGGPRIRTSLPYLQVWLVNDLLDSKSTLDPLRIRDRVLEAQYRIDVLLLDPSYTDHPLRAAVMEAKQVIEAFAEIVEPWKAVSSGSIANVEIPHPIPLSRPLITAWLFGSSDATFRWPPRDMVMLGIRDPLNGKEPSQHLDGLGGQGDIGAPSNNAEISNTAQNETDPQSSSSQADQPHTSDVKQQDSEEPQADKPPVQSRDSVRQQPLLKHPSSLDPRDLGDEARPPLPQGLPRKGSKSLDGANGPKHPKSPPDRASRRTSGQ